MNTWEPARFRDVLKQIRDVTKLTQTELAQLAERHRTQFNRWTRAENQPRYDAVSRLADAIAATHPEAAELAGQLLPAAGYGPSPPEEPVSGKTEHARIVAAETAHSPPAATTPDPSPGGQPISEAEATKIEALLSELAIRVDDRLTAMETEIKDTVERRLAGLETQVRDLRQQLAQQRAKSA